MKTIIVRWLLAILLYPIQLLAMILYALIAIPYAFIFNVNRKPLKAPNFDFDLADTSELHENNLFLDNGDDHGALTHVYYWTTKPPEYANHGLQFLVSGHGHFFRTTNGPKMLKNVSGDVVVAWCFAYAATNQTRGSEGLKWKLEKAAKHYLKNLGTVSDTGWVSARCNNFGINYCPDAWIGIGQPAFGPQYYTSAALFALAKRELGGWWHFVYWMHYILLGGWLWHWCPIVFIPSNKLGYVRDISMKSLYVLKKCRHDVYRPMNYIAREIAEYKNPLFMVLGDYIYFKEDLEVLPENIDPWFSQKIDCKSTKRGQPYVKQALKILSEEK